MTFLLEKCHITMIKLNPNHQTVKNSNSSNTKNLRATKHEGYKTRDAYEYVRLETTEASEG